MKVVVTIPAYNEAKTIGLLIKKIRAVMKKTRYPYSLIVVDDGSSDNTSEISRKAGAMVIVQPMNYGLAETFRTEIEESLKRGADAIVHMDADGQYLPEEIPKLLRELENGNDIVLGSRFMGKIEEMPLIKRLGNRVFSRVVSRIAGIRISDTQTGFRAFKRKVAEDLKIVSNHTYTQEQIIRAVRHKFIVKEVPIYFAKRDGKSRLISNPFEYAAKAIINLIRVYRDFEPLRFFGIWGGMALFLGFVLGLYLVYFQFFEEGAFRHLGLMMFDILVLSIGLQLVMFGFLADMMKKG